MSWHPQQMQNNIFKFLYKAENQILILSASPCINLTVSTDRDDFQAKFRPCFGLHSTNSVALFAQMKAVQAKKYASLFITHPCGIFIFYT
jgi:hypothetical protein